MAITAEEIRKTLTDATPLYAVVGAGDLAVEKLKALPEKFAGLKVDLPTDPKVLKEKFQATAKDMQEKAKDVQGKVTEKVSGMDVRAAAKEQADKAKGVYTDLAARGQQVVGRKDGAASGSAPAAADKPKPRRTATATSAPKPGPGKAAKAEEATADA